MVCRDHSVITPLLGPHPLALPWSFIFLQQVCSQCLSLQALVMVTLVYYSSTCASSFFIFFLAMLSCMQDLRSPTRDQTCTPCIGNLGVLTTGPPGKSCASPFLNVNSLCALFVFSLWEIQLASTVFVFALYLEANIYLNIHSTKVSKIKSLLNHCFAFSVKCSFTSVVWAWPWRYSCFSFSLLLSDHRAPGVVKHRPPPHSQPHASFGLVFFPDDYAVEDSPVSQPLKASHRV